MTEQFCSIELCKRLEPILKESIALPSRWWREHNGEFVLAMFGGLLDSMRKESHPAYSIGEMVTWIAEQNWAFDFGNGENREFFCNIAIPGEGHPFPYAGTGSTPCDAVADAILLAKAERKPWPPTYSWKEEDEDIIKRNSDFPI